MNNVEHFFTSTESLLYFAKLPCFHAWYWIRLRRNMAQSLRLQDELKHDGYLEVQE